MNFLFVTLLLGFIGSSFSTVFDFGQKFKCGYPGSWCYSLAYFDEQKTNITITRSEQTCLEGNVESQIVSKFRPSSDHGKEYVILTGIQHNCTQDGTFNQYNVRLGNFALDSEKLVINNIEDLNDAKRE